MNNGKHILIELLKEDEYYNQVLGIMIPENFRTDNSIGRVVVPAEYGKYGLSPDIKHGDYVMYPRHLVSADPRKGSGIISQILIDRDPNVDGSKTYVVLDQSLIWAGGRGAAPDIVGGDGIIAYGSKIIVKRMDTAEKVGGLYIPQTDQNLLRLNHGMIAEVVSVAAEANRAFHRKADHLKPGDEVYLAKEFAGGRLSLASGASLFSTNIWDVAAVKRNDAWVLIGDWVLVEPHSFEYDLEEVAVAGRTEMKWVSKRAKRIRGGESLVAMAPSLRQVTSGFGRVVAAGGGPGPVHPRVQAEKSVRGITYRPGLYVFHGHEMFPPHDRDSNKLATDAFWMDRRQENFGAYAFRSHHIKFAFTSERMADTEQRLEGGMALDLLNRMLST